MFGADRAGRASPRAGSRLGHSATITAREQVSAVEHWRPALVAFYERDEMPTKARLLKAGAPLDCYDERTIKALQAAFIHAAVNA